jgi:hypothetical protein
MVQNEITAHCGLPVARKQMSQATDVASRPNGKTMSIACNACPATTTFAFIPFT